MDPLLEKGIQYFNAANILFSQHLYEEASLMIFYGLPYLVKGIVRTKTDSYIYTKDVESMLNFLGRRAEYKPYIEQFLSRNREIIRELFLVPRYLNYDILDWATEERARRFLLLFNESMTLCRKLDCCI